MKKLTRIAILSALSLIIFVIESQIPPIVPIAGIKLGLANIIILYAFVTLDAKSAFFVLLIKVFLGNLFAGSTVSMFYSLLGGLLCFVAQWLMLKITTKEQIWAVSVVGAVFHNIGQIVAAIVLIGTEKIIWYLTILVPVGIITGAFTGIVTLYTMKAMDNIGITKE